jgi:hypothetical protein
MILRTGTILRSQIFPCRISLISKTTRKAATMREPVSAVGVAQTMPYMPNIDLKRNMRGISMQPLRRIERKKELNLLPVAWKSVLVR